MEQNPTYAQMLGMAESSTPVPNPVNPGIQSVMDPNAAAPLAMMQRPAQSPAELEARKSGWQVLSEKLSDPNLLRALGFAGAHMAMPGGTVGGGVATGMTAYQAGEYAGYQKDREDKLTAAKLEQEGAQTERIRATTKVEEARAPGVAADSELARRTLESRVSQAGTEAELATFKLKEAKSEAQVAEVERNLRQRKAKLESEVPDEKMRKQIAAQYDKLIAQATEQRAKAKKEEADAKLKEAELGAIKDMKPDDLRQYLTKTGKYDSGGASSAIVQQATMWGTLYDKMKESTPNDATIKGKTREQFIQARLVQAKQKDALELMVKAKQAGFSDDEIEAMGLTSLVRESLAERGASNAAAGAKETPWQDMGSGMEFRILANGVREVRRKVKDDFSGSSNMP